MTSALARSLTEYSLERPSSQRMWRLLAPGAELLCVDEPKADVRPRMHNRFCVVVVRTPSVVRLESSRSIVARENWILLLPPRHLYALRSATGLGVAPRRPPMVLQLDSLRSWGSENDCARPRVITDVGMSQRLVNLLSQLQRPVYSTDCESEARSLIEHLIEAGAAVEVARSGFAMETLNAVRDYMRDHLDEQISTATLSRFSGLTECHLIRAFHREFGLPPHAYHMQLRLAQACEALESGLSVSTVAYECGFADQSHLSRKFKDAYGITPAAWARTAAQA